MRRDAARDARDDKMYACVRLHIYLCACACVYIIYTEKRKLSMLSYNNFDHVLLLM